MFSLVFLMLRIVFFVFSIIFGKTSLLFLLPVLSIIRCELCSVLTHCDVPYCVMRTAILLFVFRIVFFQIRVFREIGRYGLVRVINCDLSRENVHKRLSVFERNSVTCKPFGSRSKKMYTHSSGLFTRSVETSNRSNGLPTRLKKISIRSNDLVTRLVKTSNCSNCFNDLSNPSNDLDHPFRKKQVSRRIQAAEVERLVGEIFLPPSSLI